MLLLVRAHAARLDVVPLLAVLPRRGYVPDFLTPPPRTARPFLRRQLAQIRATEPAQVAPGSSGAATPWTTTSIPGCSLLWSLIRSTRPARRVAPRCPGCPGSAIFECTAARWAPPQAPLDRPGPCRPPIQGRVVKVGERGFLLMPGVHLWPHVAPIVAEPWLPTPTSSAPPLSAYRRS